MWWFNKYEWVVTAWYTDAKTGDKFYFPERRFKKKTDAKKYFQWRGSHLNSLSILEIATATYVGMGKQKKGLTSPPPCDIMVS